MGRHDAGSGLNVCRPVKRRVALKAARWDVRAFRAGRGVLGGFWLSCGCDAGVVVVLGWLGCVAEVRGSVHPKNYDASVY